MNKEDYPLKSGKKWFWIDGKSNNWNVWNNIKWLVICQCIILFLMIIYLFLN